MLMTDAEKDKFVAETALNKGVDVDALAGMPADSYTDILKNADKLIEQERHEHAMSFFGKCF